nr:hypothetical protein [Limnochorda pilosa]
MVKIAPLTAIPRTMPTLRMVASMPLPWPSRSRGTLPMMALLLGGWKRPAPTPTKARRQTMEAAPLSGTSRLSVHPARASTAMPAAASSRVPQRSDSHPASGARGKNIRGKASISSPASWAVRPWTSWRKNGIRKVTENWAMKFSSALALDEAKTRLRKRATSTIGSRRRRSTATKSPREAIPTNPRSRTAPLPHPHTSPRLRARRSAPSPSPASAAPGTSKAPVPGRVGRRGITRPAQKMPAAPMGRLMRKMERHPKRVTR